MIIIQFVIQYMGMVGALKNKHLFLSFIQKAWR